MTKEDEKPTELSKISTLLQAVRRLNAEFSTRIEILKDKLDTLDFEATIVALKERESWIKALGKTLDGHKAEEGSFAANYWKKG